MDYLEFLVAAEPSAIAAPEEPKKPALSLTQQRN
jgi:hypothetical protein